MFYNFENRSVEAIGPLAEALPIEERQFGPDDIRTGEVLAQLAAAYLAGLQLNDARPLLVRLEPLAAKYQEI